MSLERIPASTPEFRLPQVVKGETVFGADRSVAGFPAAALDINRLIWPRTEPGPAFDTPLAEIIDLLVATGERLRADPDGYLAEACAFAAHGSDLDQSILEAAYAGLHAVFDRDEIERRLAGELGNAGYLDGWCELEGAGGKKARVRAFPPRMVHILAGNVPAVGALTIVRGALTKGVHLLKLPSNDLFSATAVLRTMAAVAPNHPVVRSFSAVYWRGGDESVEGVLFSPQFFDKLVAWGGEGALRTARKYIGPGFELVAFDPKTSISFVGREAFASEESLHDAVRLGAGDVTIYNQFACSASRIQFVEGDEADVDRYCELLVKELGVPGARSSHSAGPTPPEVRDEVDALRMLEPMYRVWGGYDGAGLVVRSDEPVEFYPTHKTVNVVPVRSLDEAVQYVTVATQTVGIYPAARKVQYRDVLASAGVQRIVTLGSSMGGVTGVSHDGFLPIHRFMRWVNDED